jgi:hypothetical protein
MASISSVRPADAVVVAPISCLVTPSSAGGEFPSKFKPTAVSRPIYGGAPAKQLIAAPGLTIFAHMVRKSRMRRA